jgi:hypothetical protein
LKKFALSLIAVAVVALGLYLQLAPDSGKERVPGGTSRAAAGASRPLSSDAVLTIAPGAPRTPMRGIEPKPLSPLMREYARSRDYKALYDRLRSIEGRTAEETYVLARLLEDCARFTELKETQPLPRSKLELAESRERFMATVSESDPNREKRIAAYDEVSVDRCGRLRESEVTLKHVRDLFEKAAGAGDPRARARLVEQALRDAMTAADGSVHIPGRPQPLTDAQVETLRQSMQSGDPYAVVATVRAMNAWPGMVTVRGGSGETSVNVGTLFTASYLAACELGVDCGPDVREVLNGCAFQGNCGARDYRDYMFFYGMPPATAQLAGEYQAGILRAIQGDWSYFNFRR